MSPKVDRCLTRSYFPGHTSVCNSTLPHPGTSFLKHKNVKVLSKICPKALIVNSAPITALSNMENRFWANSASSQQEPQDQVWVSARYVSGPYGHDELIWLHDQLSLHQQGPLGNTKLLLLSVQCLLWLLQPHCKSCLSLSKQRHLQSHWWKPKFKEFSLPLWGEELSRHRVSFLLSLHLKTFSDNRGRLVSLRTDRGVQNNGEWFLFCNRLYKKNLLKISAKFQVSLWLPSKGWPTITSKLQGHENSMLFLSQMSRKNLTASLIDF